MRSTLQSLILASGIVLMSLPLGGCFMAVIPGPVVSALQDGMTGQRGEHCVASTQRIGDHIRLPTGNTGTIESLSGTSRRCTNPNLPIRAKITT